MAWKQGCLIAPSLISLLPSEHGLSSSLSLKTKFFHFSLQAGKWMPIAWSLLTPYTSTPRENMQTLLRFSELQILREVAHWTSLVHMSGPETFSCDKRQRHIIQICLPK